MGRYIRHDIEDTFMLLVAIVRGSAGRSLRKQRMLLPGSQGLVQQVDALVLLCIWSSSPLDFLVLYINWVSKCHYSSRRMAIL